MVRAGAPHAQKLVTPPGLVRYVAFMQTLSVRGLQELPALVTEDVEFRDPFNNLRGAHDLEACLREMLSQIGDLRIVVTHVGRLEATAERESALWCLRWHFGGKLLRLRGQPWSVVGMSEVTLAADGRVARHLDYWDAAQGLYETLPLVGGFQRWLRRRLAVPGVRQHQDAAH